jgi:hypothetical protein
VDKAVQDGIIQPGLYLILEFDFSCVARYYNLHESAESLAREINRGLLRFKGRYTKYLGESFASDTSAFMKNDPAGNLRCLIKAVDLALQNIRDRDKKDEKDDPLPGVQGVCLFQTTAHHNTNTNT